MSKKIYINIKKNIVYIFIVIKFYINEKEVNLDNPLSINLRIVPHYHPCFFLFCNINVMDISGIIIYWYHVTIFGLAFYIVYGI